MNFQHCQCKAFLITILDVGLHNFIFSIISILSNELQIFQKYSDYEVYDVYTTRDVLVFLIMLNTSANVNALKQLFDHSFIVQYIICGDVE